MKIRFVWVGKAKDAHIKGLAGHYLERVRKFAPVEVAELRDRSDVGGDARRIIEKEGEDIMSRVASDPFVVALDERGRQMGSRELARLVERHQVGATRQMTFIVGGHNGLSEQVRERADLVLALSEMTLTHELARVLLIEQVYRAFAIINGLPYQK